MCFCLGRRLTTAGSWHVQLKQICMLRFRHEIVSQLLAAFGNYAESSYGAACTDRLGANLPGNHPALWATYSILQRSPAAAVALDTVEQASYCHSPPHLCCSFSFLFFPSQTQCFFSASSLYLIVVHVWSICCILRSLAFPRPCGFLAVCILDRPQCLGAC